MESKNLFDKVWDLHTIKKLKYSQTQLFIGTHYIHEVTSPQAFSMLREQNLTVKYPDLTFATVDHIIPTNEQVRPFTDKLAENMIQELEKNCAQFDIKYFNLQSGKQGIVHVIGPELGITQPGMTIACGDSHTSTHGAFGNIAFGIGTSQIRDVLATQSLILKKPKVRKIEINGNLRENVSAKDVILHIIGELGVNGGMGYAYEYNGNLIKNMNMEERMTVCNMTIEGGGQYGYINPDNTTFSYLSGREFAPKDDCINRSISFWKTLKSSPNAFYDDVININANKIEPTVTWGINPGQNIGITERIPLIKDFQHFDRNNVIEGLNHIGFEEGESIIGKKIDVAFIGSCTNSRITDLREAAKILKERKIAKGVRAIVVPGSQLVAEEAENEGIDLIFKKAGFEWRKPGCSMCLAMNPDKLDANEICASTSNRNFIGRQGHSSSKTMLMSPAMVAAAAINGKIVDVREL